MKFLPLLFALTAPSVLVLSSATPSNTTAPNNTITTTASPGVRRILQSTSGANVKTRGCGIGSALSGSTGGGGTSVSGAHGEGQQNTRANDAMSRGEARLQDDLERGSDQISSSGGDPALAVGVANALDCGDARDGEDQARLTAREADENARQQTREQDEAARKNEREEGH